MTDDERATLLTENDGEPYVCAVCGERVLITAGIVQQLKDGEAWLVCLECRAKQITVIRENLR